MNTAKKATKQAAVMVTFRAPPSLAKSLDRVAKRHRRSRSAQLLVVLEEHHEIGNGAARSA